MPINEQKLSVFQKLDYAPSAEQLVVHLSPTRIRLVSGGERSGKSKLGANEFLSRFYEGRLYWLVAADYNRTSAEFNYICEGLDKLGIYYEATKRVDPGEIIIEGGFKVVTKSAGDPRKLAMEAPDGVIGCEASQLDYETFLRLRGRVAEKRGWILLSGTFESSLGWYPELYLRWQAPNDDDAVSFSLPTWSNLAVFPGGRTDPEILALERASSKEWFLERYGGVPCPPKGLVFNEFSNHIHTGIGGYFEFDPAEPCYIWVDPGYQHFYAVEVAQKRGENVVIVDEIYERGLVTSEMIVVARQKPWWNKVIGGAIDIAGTQHQAMPAPAEIWLRESGILLRSQKIQIEYGIERMKSALKVNPKTGRPQLSINARCRGLISELGGCPNPHTSSNPLAGSPLAGNPLAGQTLVYKWRMDKDNLVIGLVPEDKNNDACKAVCYGLVDLLGYTASQRRVAPVKFY